MDKFCSAKKSITDALGRKKDVCRQERSKLIPMLQKAQGKKGYVSNKQMQQIADELGIHPVEVYSVVTFYSFLSSQKKGKHSIRISNCLPSHISGNKKIIKAFEGALKIKVGETTPDGKISLEETSCIGMCDQAPAALVDGELIGKLTPGKVKKIVKQLK
jgi:NADH:ubiquinone oxidoreductase subunit E